MQLSIVTTLYLSGPYILEFYERIVKSIHQLKITDYQIIFVNDGSPDNSLDIAMELVNKNARVVLVDLSRNFGHHKAMLAGLQQASGELVFLIDSDLEEQPEWLSSFYSQLAQEKCDVVFGAQRTRKGHFFEILTGKIFYSLFRLLTDINQPNNIVTARLMTKHYVEALLSHKEYEINIGGLWLITGFQQNFQHVAKLNTSPTTYSFKMKFSHFVNAVTSFSSKPLVFTFYSGLVICLTAIFFILTLVFRYIFISSPPSGYTSLIASVWFFSGIIVFFMGIQSIYVSKIFSETKRRPLTIQKNIYTQLSQSKADSNEKN